MGYVFAYTCTGLYCKFNLVSLKLTKTRWYSVSITQNITQRQLKELIIIIGVGLNKPRFKSLQNSLGDFPFLLPQPTSTVFCGRKWDVGRASTCKLLWPDWKNTRYKWNELNQSINQWMNWWISKSMKLCSQFFAVSHRVKCKYFTSINQKEKMQWIYNFELHFICYVLHSDFPKLHVFVYAHCIFWFACFEIGFFFSIYILCGLLHRNSELFRKYVCWNVQKMKGIHKTWMYRQKLDMVVWQMST